jgi:asparagine synthase (glutamine-hydrolysing)
MCGIAGILRTGERPLPAPGALRRMLSSFEYRGPDESGEFLGDDVQLGVVRLAIIDLKGGRQPVSAGGDRTVAVYNGEIYNYQELRRRLHQGGHELPNACDATVVPYLYEEQGEDFLLALRGMYAFALWDGHRRQLLLARDRLGIKPLYWAQTRDYLVFASEVKAIFASGLVAPEIDRRSLDDLFSLSYPCPPRTMFEGVYEVPPAHVVTATPGRPVGPPRRYWSAPFRPRGEHRPGRRRDLEAELRDLLRRRVYDHLQADVRVGAYLSGGLDSSAIGALVKEVTGDPPVTFSIGFEDPAFDETPHAEAMAAHLGAENHRIICGPELAAEYPRTLWHTELPLQFPLALPLMQLAALARREGFPVILTGEGADELMGGYDCFRAQKMRRVLDRPGLRGMRPFLFRQLYQWLGTPEGTVDFLLEVQRRPIDDVAREFGGVFPAWYDTWQGLDLERELLLSPDGRAVRSPAVAPEEFSRLVPENVEALHPLDAQLALELQTRLPSWILLIGDRAGMANAVETRVPLLDHEVVEFVASLHPSHKIRGFQEKAILRGALRGLLPEDLRQRQKRPFYTPVKSWFFSAGAPEYVDEALSERALRDAGLFAPEVVKKLRQDLETVPEQHLLRHRLEWVLLQVLGVQLLQRLFVTDLGGSLASHAGLDGPMQRRL